MGFLLVAESVPSLSPGDSDLCCDKMMMQKKDLAVPLLAFVFTLILAVQANATDRGSKVGIFNLVNPVQFKSDSCTGSSNSSLTGYDGSLYLQMYTHSLASDISVSFVRV